MPKFYFFGLLSLLPLLVSAANDWSIPCMDGTCSWDAPTGKNTMAGTMTITGSPNAISDITTAAGWEILNCTTDAKAQDIRIVCSGDEESCSHLFQNGAEHTVVRLPQDCGPGPFARVVSCEEAEDQSLPEYLSTHLRRRDGSARTVHALSFDTKFNQIPSSQHGNVSMVVFGSTIPGFNGNATITPAGSRRRSRIANKRSFDSFFDDFNKTKSTDLSPINIDNKFNIFNTTLPCSAGEQARLSVDVDAKVNAQVTIGVVLAGSLTSGVTEFGLFADVSAVLDGGLSIDANIAGEFDSGKIKLFTSEFYPFNIPSLIYVGPTFDIDAEAKANIDLDVDMSVDLAYEVSDLRLFFPPSDGKTSSATIAPKDTPLKLSASPEVQSNATLEVHLIPSLNFGINVLDGLGSATIFLDIDTFAELDLGLVAGGTASADTASAIGASAQARGCVDLNGGVSVNAGAKGSFFDLFDDSTQVSLFSKNFDFFKKCFEESASTTNSATFTSSPVSNSASSVNPSSTVSLSVSESAGTGISSSASAHTPSTPSTSLSTSSTLVVADLASASTADSSFVTASSTVADDSTATPSASSTTESSTSTLITVADDSTTVLSSSSTSKAANATPTSPEDTKGQNSSRSRRAHVPAHIKLARRDFQCLAADVAPATSLVDQNLSSTSFTS
ncbi:uncharacterized protein FOMMEDRAFT_108994 [Fomitiporia mediterranea MF3/22]|uniref:uncharacterized protein n=1 Tax=Fomitiporia mediterranea (strain MF3/22) TaxID=694068 RepID=UPI000440792A|nr:uncharacterized protein FOMMEDRAFT_108994 [Fomitiporia mediterranea MF3/22]EJD01946.1 hypothetical protein FOMMEDRAFT_108994 [Fomitiporia mediterranea MF3/22]